MPRLWVNLEPWQWRAGLAKVHPDLTEGALIAEGLRVPELRPQIDRQKSREDRMRVVLRYFGDEQHPQPPGEPARYGPSAGGPGVYQCPRFERLPPLDDDAEADTGEPTAPGAKSRWRRADLHTILVTKRSVSARQLAESSDLVERLHHQRISELRARRDIRVENDRVVLPPGTTSDGGGWITLPKRG